MSEQRTSESDPADGGQSAEQSGQSAEPDALAVLYGVAAGVATITLNEPSTRNALSPAVLDGLIACFERARDDESVRAVVLASSHDTVFSSGANLGGFAADAPLVHRHFGSERFVALFKLIGTLGKPTLVAASGHVLAGALGIALACDLIVAKDTATFGTPEINVGAFPFMIMAFIYRNVPRKKANELLLLGERWSADQALAAGLVNKVVPAGGVRRGGGGVGGQARLQVAGDHAPRQGSDAPPARHAAGRRARLPARAAHARDLDRGHRGGRNRLLPEARARMEGAMSLAAAPTRRGPGGALARRSASAAARRRSTSSTRRAP